MPASAPSVETIAALVRLGGGALDLWMLLHATAGDDNISYLTNANIAEMTGRTSRWIQLASQRLRDANFLIGGSGMWKVSVGDLNAQVQNFADAKIPSHACEQNFADANEISHDDAPPPSLTLSPPVRESVALVVHNVDDVNERENDASPPHSPPSSPEPTPEQIAALDLLAEAALAEYAAGKTTPLAEVVKRAERRAKAEAYPPEFQALWSAYPHFSGRSDKRKSLAKWLELSEQDRELAAANLPAWKASHDWSRDGGQYVPGMQVWLGKTGIRYSPPPASSISRSPKNGGYSREELLRQIAEGDDDDHQRHEETPRYAANLVARGDDRRPAHRALSPHAGGPALAGGEWGGRVAHGGREVVPEARRTAGQGDHLARRDRPL